jgi:hypothetical protein
MKVALICPANMIYMPYVGNYEKILKENNVDYTIINWDRFQIEDTYDEFKYRDKKVGHQRRILDYFKYKKFIIKKLKENKYDKLIVFSLQLCYFLKKYLVGNYKGKYVIDIRDYNKIIKFFNIKTIVDNSDLTVISSAGYKQWLSNSNKYAINHNTQINSLKELRPVNINHKEEKISISCIGAIRDYDINIDFINSLKNNDKIKVYYHGEGPANGDIKAYLTKNSTKNVTLSGRYIQGNEEKLYAQSDLINVFRNNDDINNKTALPNRLYNSVLYGKPMIAVEGTYLSEQIKKYKVGLILDSFDQIENNINKYLKEFHKDEYERGRTSFFENVIQVNEHFKIKLTEFLV